MISCSKIKKAWKILKTNTNQRPILCTTLYKTMQRSNFDGILLTNFATEFYFNDIFTNLSWFIWDWMLGRSPKVGFVKNPDFSLDAFVAELKLKRARRLRVLGYEINKNSSMIAVFGSERLFLPNVALTRVRIELIVHAQFYVASTSVFVCVKITSTLAGLNTQWPSWTKRSTKIYTQIENLSQSGAFLNVQTLSFFSPTGLLCVFPFFFSVRLSFFFFLRRGCSVFFFRLIQLSVHIFVEEEKKRVWFHKNLQTFERRALVCSSYGGNY